MGLCMCGTRRDSPKVINYPSAVYCVHHEIDENGIQFGRHGIDMQVAASSKSFWSAVQR